MLLLKLEIQLTNTPEYIHIANSFHLAEFEHLDNNKIHTLKNLLVSQNIPYIQFILLNIPSLVSPIFEQDLLALLKNNDAIVHLKSCELLTILYGNTFPKKEYVNYIKQHLFTDDYDMTSQMLRFLCDLLYNKRESINIINSELVFRNALKIDFCNDETFMRSLTINVKVKETQYFALKLLMILSYEKQSVPILEKYHLIENVINILREMGMEKIMRICISFIKNIVHHYEFSILSIMDIIKICENTYKDNEMNIEKEDLKRELKVKLKNTSHLDSFYMELFNGKLEESPFHYSDKFWEGNCANLLENKVEIIKAIKKYLKCSNITKVCVSANDIFRFVRVAPEIYSLIEKYGVKEDLVDLTGSDNEDVRFYAIQALTCCIFSEWS